jgi:hypothetical protein
VSSGAWWMPSWPPLARAGVIVVPGTKPIAVVGFAVEDGRIVEIDVIANPAKLAHLDLSPG